MGRRSWVSMMVLVGALLVPTGVASAGGFCSGYEGERVTDEAGATVALEKNCFGPTVLRVSRGHAVTFVNRDPEVHTVGGTAGSFGDMHRELAPGRSVSFRFDEEGIFPYVCLIHPGMAGAIVVGDGTPDAKVAAAAPAGTQVGPQQVAGAQRPNEQSAAVPRRGSSALGRALSLGVLALLLAAVARLALGARRKENEARPQQA